MKPLDYYQQLYPPGPTLFKRGALRGPAGSTATLDELLTEDGEALITEDGESILTETP